MEKEIDKRAIASFEAGIKLGALFHQFIGVPVSEKNVEILEKAIESCVRLQPYVVDIEIKIDRKKLKEVSSFGYCSLSPEMIKARVVVEFEGERVEAILEWDEKLRYPLMKLL
ncbi:MAG: dihydroneopterin aldolase family protein [Archaeoglobaceae archaeon]|nr:dihydroneopterin aldolase family protein [Archaeoglobaceae archaeon]MDW8117680.1 dihydroneopterin aldolase family protein [Archaeoglobaceae archaeon]